MLRCTTLPGFFTFNKQLSNWAAGRYAITLNWGQKASPPKLYTRANMTTKIMHEETTGPMYNIWARFYDRTFGACVIERQRRAVEQLHLKPGDQILDLGVGTGMTIKYFPQDVDIIGMDLSEGMLEKAKRKCEKNDWQHVKLVQGDAMRPPFKDAGFDHALICHTISVVSDPARLLRWVAKLVKPGGQIVLLNHFRSTNRVMGWFERVTNPFWIKVGWRSDVALEEVLQNANLRMTYQFKPSVLDLWQIVVLEHDVPATAAKPASQPAAAEPAMPAGVQPQLAGV